jgi:hypothetical protein
MSKGEKVLENEVEKVLGIAREEVWEQVWDPIWGWVRNRIAIPSWKQVARQVEEQVHTKSRDRLKEELR